MLKRNNKGYFDVTGLAAEELIEMGEVEVLDIRRLEEYEQGHIPNSKLLPLEEILQWSKELNPEKKYLLVCRSGNRTAQAGEYLAGIGYQHIYNMLGGMIEWPGDIEPED